MKAFKILSILAVAALLLAPASAIAKGPRFSFSLNVMDVFAPPPPPIFVPAPAPPPPVIVQEYYYPMHPYW